LALDKQADATDRTGCSAPTRQWGFCSSVAAISGVTIVAGRSPHWPAAIVTDCSIPAYKTERPSCADDLVLRPATPPFKGANAPPDALELQH